MPANHVYSTCDIEYDREIVRRVNGLYLGQLTIDEQDAFYRLVDAGIACRDYSSLAGYLLDMAKVALLPVHTNVAIGE